MKTFEINKVYETRSICDYDCIFSYTVIARTAKTITIKDKFSAVKKLRIIAGLSAHRGAESVYPEGKYSMCPVICAADGIIKKAS